VVAARIGFERLKTNPRIVHAGREIQKGVLPLCRVAGITAIWRRTDGLQYGREGEANDYDPNQPECVWQ
jgi:hypothetical protein